ncbi:MAG: zf-HC2 domain-containing protein [Acidobacteria bacterium]|nr:zf-HC2 domain-containing protein [Acidobacteriota bacterium]
MREHSNSINCSQFEDLLSDYIDKALDPVMTSAMGEHALSCPLCHALLNDVKESLGVCHTLHAPKMPMARLEARVLSATAPDAGLSCEEFEGYLTDYLDGFLPAKVFHRWERHAVCCDSCEDLPGMVVRSIAACYTYKLDELAVPEGLVASILAQTSEKRGVIIGKQSIGESIRSWIEGIRLPLPLGQLAPVAMLLIFAFLIFGQTVSADGTATNVYKKGFELAEATYQQSAGAWNGTPAVQPVSK